MDLLVRIGLVVVLLWVPFKGLAGPTAYKRETFLGYGLFFESGPGWPTWPYLNGYSTIQIDYERIALELVGLLTLKALFGTRTWSSVRYRLTRVQASGQ